MIKVKVYFFVLGFLLFSIKGFATEWYMVGASEFKPTSSSVSPWESGEGKVQSPGATQVVSSYSAPIHLPIGSTVTSLYCQVRDNSSTASIRIELRRVGTEDNGVPDATPPMATIYTGWADTPDYTKISTTSITSPVIDDWIFNPGSGTTTYYSYSLVTYVPEGLAPNSCGTNCQMRACAIGYDLPIKWARMKEER